MRKRAGAAAPWVFVFLWSTGFISTRYAVPYAPPFTLLAIRMFVACAVLALIATTTGSSWPDREGRRRSAITGLLLHTGYLGGVFFAIDRHVPAGLSSIIVNLQPVLLAAVSRRLLDERLTRRQWIGIGLGFIGVTLAVIEKLLASEASISRWGIVALLVALVSSTAGTLHHKRHGDGIPLLAGTATQYLTAGVVFAALGLTFEHRSVHVTHQLVLAVGWMVGVLSIGAVLLMLWLLRTTGASKVGSLYYLVPPLTAIEAYILFDERMGAVALVGAVLAVLGVALVVRTPAAMTEVTSGR